MGILNTALGSGGLGLIPKIKTNKPKFVGGDFPDGLIITEYINGQADEENQIILKGTFAPHSPIEFGGTQRTVKENYAGSKIASLQILGPEEDDITFTGNMKTKFLRGTETFSDEEMRLVAEKFQEDIEAMRRRGNLVQVQLGEWTRYGVLSASKFRLKTRAEIEYDITFIIQSEVFPAESRFTDHPDDDIASPNKALKDAALSQLDAARNFPDDMPQSIGDVLNGAISDVAAAVAVVTDFVDGILDDVEQVQASVNRAIGLIRYARAKIAVSARRVGSISHEVSTLGATVFTAFEQGAATIKNISHINKTQRSFQDLTSFLAALQAKFAAMRASVPLYRRIVKEGDTLQKYAMKHYANPDLWIKIYEHNRLRSTKLVVGSTIEIPRV